LQQKAKKDIMGKLTISQQKIISLLVDKKEFSIKELSKKTGIQQANLTKEIRELQDRTLITVREDPEDKRYKLVKLSQKTYLSFVFSKEVKED